MTKELKERFEEIQDKFAKLDGFQNYRQYIEAGNRPTRYELLDMMQQAYALDRDPKMPEGWISYDIQLTPYTGWYLVRDSDGNEFECVYIDFGEDRGWQSENLIVAYHRDKLNR